ncbi:MAG: hypothetical protein QM607_12035 [Microbacterium sp.]
MKTRTGTLLGVGGVAAVACVVVVLALITRQGEHPTPTAIRFSMQRTLYVSADDTTIRTTMVDAADVPKT